MNTDSPTLKILRDWIAKHPLVVIGAFLAVCLCPFINKAVHIDDPLFVWSAEWILKHPSDFYGFGVNWYGATELMATVNCNPPAVAYFLAAVGSVFGWREIALHGALIPVAFVAAAGIYQLAKIWCGRPLLATIVAVSTPVFLVSSTTLMCDVPMLALWVWAVVMWERALNDGHPARFLAAGTLAGLAVLTKYSALTFLPLLLILGLLHKRRPGGWWLWLAVPVAMMGVYEFATGRLYGQGLISAAADYAAERRSSFEGGWTAKGIIGLAFAGGSLLPTLFFAPWLWSRRRLLTGSLLALGFSLAALSFCEKLGPMDLTSGYGASWGFWLQMSLMMTGGLHLLLLTGAELWRRRDPVTIVLALWVFSGFIFATVLNWSINARSLLTVVPAAAILLIRRLERETPVAIGCNPWIWPLIPSTLISLSVATADFELANSARTAAQEITTQYRAAASRLWFEGHWGFQYYMEKLGAQPVDAELSTLQPGDILVVPLNNSNVLWPTPEDAEMVKTAEFKACSWLSSMQVEKGAGFYVAIRGPLPFTFGLAPPEKYCVFKILRPVRLGSPAPNGSETSDPQILQAEYEAALQENPKDARAHAQLAFRLQQQGKMDEAIGHYRESLRLMPDQPGVLNNFAWLLATCPEARIRNGEEAVQLAGRACTLTRDSQTFMIGTLAAAYAEAGRFAEAVATAQRACALASKLGAQDLLHRNQELLELYRQHRPYREVANPNPPDASSGNRSPDSNSR